MKIQNGQKYEIVEELPRRGKKDVVYWVMSRTGYDAYIYRNKHWTKVDERTVKDVTTR